MNLPQQYSENMRALLGGEFEAFLASMEKPHCRALRENPMRPAGSAFAGKPVPWYEGAYYIEEESLAGSSIQHFAGAFYLQEPSAMTAAAVLNVQKNERVLDLCAAPGGKATQLASRAGALVANEIEPKRAKILLGNIERMGAWNAAVTNETPQRLADALPETFDAVLVDAPCSGEGMFRRDETAVREWTESANAGCSKRQKEILSCAARMVRPGGRMVYSTCTFSPLENEENIVWFLKEHPDFYAEDFSLPGLGTSQNGCMRLYPHRVEGEGHFVAKLRRKGEWEPLDDMPPRGVKLPDGVREFFAELPEGEILHQGEMYLLRAPLLPELKGLRALRGAIPLATERKGIFRPEHAAAMAFEPKKRAQLDLAMANQYLHGAPVDIGNDAENGWTRAEFESLPLGWGKVTSGELKNHLPKGLVQRNDLHDGK